MSFFNYIYFFFILILIQNCSNTRVVVEGVKTVINKNKENKKVISEESKDYVKGHYKIGNPYEINNITYIPKLVS